MQQLMQTSDFLALCKGPENGGYFEYKNPYSSGRAPTHHGMGGVNQRRVIEDWFPVGETFHFLGSSCMSRGVLTKEPGRHFLVVLTKGLGGVLVEQTFSTREVLSIARQISVDRCNALAETA